MNSDTTRQNPLPKTNVDRLNSCFPQMSGAEQALLDSVQNGNSLDVNKLPKSVSRELRAEFISELILLGIPEDSNSVLGIDIRNARITGQFLMQNMVVRVVLSFVNCLFDKPLILRDSECRAINLSDCTVPGIDGNGLKTTGTLFLRKTVVENGLVSLNGAKIDGVLDCRGANFSSQKGDCFRLVNATVKNDLLMSCMDGKPFCTNGAIRLKGTLIGGNLDCSGAQLSNPGKVVFYGDLIEVSGMVLFRNGFQAKGDIRLNVASIGTSLDCSNNVYIQKGSKYSINCYRIKIGGSIFLTNSFVSEGGIRFLGAKIGGSVEILRGVRICAKEESALDFEKATIDGSIKFSKDVQVEGLLGLRSTKVATNLTFGKHTTFLYNSYSQKPDAPLLNCHSLSVGGTLFFSDSTKLKGTLSLINAFADTLCDNCKSWPSEENCFIYLEGFRYNRIGTGDTPTNATQRIKWLQLQSPQMLLQDFRPQPFEQLAKTFRKMGHTNDARKIEIEKRLQLRKAWMHKSEALSVPQTVFFFIRTRSYLFLDLVFEKSIGYGYAPWNLVVWILVLQISGWAVFDIADKIGIMVPSDSRIYMKIKTRKSYPAEFPKFNSFIYSLDTLIPLVSLHQEKYWEPSVNHPDFEHNFTMKTSNNTLPTGKFVRFYLWFQIIAGWMLASLGAAALTGLMKRQ